LSNKRKGWNTIVVFGSARFNSEEDGQRQLESAKASNDSKALLAAQRTLRNAKFYALAREFGGLVARYSANLPISERLYICTGGGPGIMEGAHTVVHMMWGCTLGLNIALPHEQGANPYVTPSLNFKFHYLQRAKCTS